MMVRKMFTSMHVWIYICKKKISHWFSYSQMSFYGNGKFHYWWGKLINMSQLSPQDTVLIPTMPLLFKTFLEFFICDYFQSQFISYMRKINCANFFLTRNRLIWPYHPPCSSGLISGWFISVQSLSHVRIFVAPWTSACQASLPINSSRSLLKLMSIESVIPSNHLILCRPLLLLPSIFPSIRVFSNESVLFHIRWPKDWSFSFSISPSNEYSGLISLGWTGWISLQSKGLSRVFSNITVQKASILQHSAFFMLQLSHPYMTTG